MKKTNNNLTELVFILDKSGSMSGLESDTIGGFNSFINKQKQAEGECLVSTVLFADNSEVLHDRVSLEKIEPLSEKDYVPMGCTALYDALGNAIRHIANIHKYARKSDVPQKTVFVVITDGYENASRFFTHSRLKALIEKQKKEYDWEFLFIGANIDAEATAVNIGISRDRAVNYNADSVGTKVVFDSIAAPVMACRANKEISDDWAESINDDYNSRK